ncbi:hypothetical protein DFQ27_008220 [Actinomortierella ambigua]|uniref:Trichothecene 3-O-acetyltransferase-like N-terminal domain-containing protein n=1 Tax=Actinomortierella ambigua TaxID=1343610 RepID=A0A9P6PQZ8_9FUNG|nr:hypothetical protein DFQ27_008220 [Actinomortierella ambigua]
MMKEFKLGILGQQPLQSIYTPITLAYAVDDETNHSNIIDTLKTGLLKLTESFPWVAGQVVNEGATLENSGIYKIVPFEEHPPLVVKDLRDDPNISTFASLKETKFPCSAPVLDENVLSARHGMACFFDHASPRPALFVQATFIKGGLLLTFTAHHLVFDMIGQGHIMSLLSKACHGLTFNRKELASGNLSRENLIPFLDRSVNPMDDPSYDFQLAKPKPAVEATTTTTATLEDSQSELESTPAAMPELPKATWAYFSFDATSLATLKADTHTSRLDSVPYISTDDAVTALIYQSAIRARLPRIDPTSQISLTRTVDMRRAMNVPETHPGLMMNMVYRSMQAQQLVDQDLGALASLLREDLLDEPRLVQRTRGLATLLRDLPNKWGLSFTAGINLDINMLSSSWAKVQCHHLEFNLGLGRPVAVRRPVWTPSVENVSYLMPKSPEGEIIVGICLRDADMERLKVDPVFNKYGQYIG